MFVSWGDASGVAATCFTSLPAIPSNLHALAHLVEDVATGQTERGIRLPDLASGTNGVRHPAHVFDTANQGPYWGLHAQQRRHHGLTSHAVSQSKRARFETGASSPRSARQADGKGLPPKIHGDRDRLHSRRPHSSSGQSGVRPTTRRSTAESRTVDDIHRGDSAPAMSSKPYLSNQPHGPLPRDAVDPRRPRTTPRPSRPTEVSRRLTSLSYVNPVVFVGCRIFFDTINRQLSRDPPKPPEMHVPHPSRLQARTIEPRLVAKSTLRSLLTRSVRPTHLHAPVTKRTQW